MTPARYALLAGLLVLAGCATGTTIYYSDNNSLYYPAFVQYAASSGKMAVEIHGSPFGAASPGGAAAIASTLRMPPGFGDARFTTTPNPKRAKQRLVMVFNPVLPSPSGSAVCGDPSAIKRGPAADPMRVAMALCSSADWVSQATVVGPKGSGPNDPAFRHTLEDGLRELMPVSAYNSSRSCDSPC